jgi:hypothetical protein
VAVPLAREWLQRVADPPARERLQRVADPPARERLQRVADPPARERRQEGAVIPGPRAARNPESILILAAAPMDQDGFPLSRE